MIIKKSSKENYEILNDLLSHTEFQAGCLEWKGCLNTDGYPRMARNGSLNVKVHRYVAELSSSQDIAGKVVRHTCDNPKCINPNHLLLGTHKDNMDDRSARDRVPKRITLNVIHRVQALLATNLLTHKQISDIVGIDARRVSDINCGKYCSTTGRLLRYG